MRYLGKAEWRLELEVEPGCTRGYCGEACDAESVEICNGITQNSAAIRQRKDSGSMGSCFPVNIKEMYYDEPIYMHEDDNCILRVNPPPPTDHRGSLAKML